jgi:hypothetical protein
MKRLFILFPAFFLIVSCDLRGLRKSPSSGINPLTPPATNEEYIAVLSGSVYECDFYKMESSRGLIQITEHSSSVHFQNPDSYRYEAKHSFAYDTSGSQNKYLYDFNTRTETTDNFEAELLFINYDWSGKYVFTMDFPTRSGDIKLFSIDKNGIKENILDSFNNCFKLK